MPPSSKRANRASHLDPNWTSSGPAEVERALGQPSRLCELTVFGLEVPDNTFLRAEVVCTSKGVEEMVQTFFAGQFVIDQVQELQCRLMTRQDV